MDQIFLKTHLIDFLCLECSALSKEYIETVLVEAKLNYREKAILLYFEVFNECFFILLSRKKCSLSGVL